MRNDLRVDNIYFRISEIDDEDNSENDWSGNSPTLILILLPSLNNNVHFIYDSNNSIYHIVIKSHIVILNQLL